MTSALILPAQFILEKCGLPLTDEQPLQLCVGEFAAFLGLLGASMIMAFVEHKPLISFGLDGKRPFIRLSYGAVSGVIALSGMICVLKLSGFLLFDGQPIVDWNAMKFAFAWGAGFFLVGLYEEYLFRGYLQKTLTRGIGFWWSALVLSIAFGISHIFNKGESTVGVAAVTLLGLVLCISLWYLKDLWWAIGFHSSWDWAQSYFWGTANSGKVLQSHLFSVHPQGNILFSGGSTGPEGSVMVIPLLLFIAFLMWIVWRRKTPQQSEKVDTTTTSQS